VADDAFQHRRLGRAVDVVLIDAACPFGNGHVIPAGILREPLSALRRAHAVVITKSEQAEPSAIAALKERISEFVPAERVFTTRLVIDDWALWQGGRLVPFDGGVRGLRLSTFSAIGNPLSFVRTLEGAGAAVVSRRYFRDHHAYTDADMDSLAAGLRGADFLSCTEKDIRNLPNSWRGSEARPPLLVPRVTVVPDEPDRFFGTIVDCLRPRLVVASNGYGEDAIGALLAEKLRRAFPAAEVVAFPLVGRGEAYKNRGFAVASTPSVTPSGGVVKYRLADLWGDIRAGLFGHIRSQQADWLSLAGRVRTPICVGDVYLLLHTLWGRGLTPLLVATAKTVRISGHFGLERFVIRRFCRRTWTRDPETAAQLDQSKGRGGNAVYAGSPIMDLLQGVTSSAAAPVCSPVKILLLPGSRERAYSDVRMLADAAEMMARRMECGFVMVAAPGVDFGRLASACAGWDFAAVHASDESGEGALLRREGNVKIALTRRDVSEAACGASLLIGFGGTANQLCAGMGIPVVSIDEKGKRIQKKLLGDAEVLVEANAEALAGRAVEILSDLSIWERMSAAGRERMGEPGALDDAVTWASERLGWRAACEVYETLSAKRRGIIK
jgi:tetraacyldisaccharide 4'-kinase